MYILLMIFNFKNHSTLLCKQNKHTLVASSKLKQLKILMLLLFLALF
jgi:hypothetical protein